MLEPYEVQLRGRPLGFIPSGLLSYVLGVPVMLRALLLSLAVFTSVQDLANPQESTGARDVIRAQRNGEPGGVYKCWTPTGQGSLIAIEQTSDPEHVYFFTTSHVVPGREPIRVEIHGHRYDVERVTDWHGMDLWKDGQYSPERLVMLRTKASVKTKVYYYPLRRTPLQVGDKVHVVGFPHGKWRGQTTTLRSIQSDHYVAGVEVKPGASGGALMDDRGQVVGVIVSSRCTTSCINIARATKNFADGRRVRWCQPSLGCYPLFP